MYAETRRHVLGETARIALRSCRMIGRAGARRATSLKPARVNVAAMPVKVFVVLFGTSVSIGYASSAAPRALRDLQSRKDQLSHDSLPAIALAHEETRDRPDGQCVHTFEPPHVIKPGIASRGVSWHQPTANSPSKAINPGGEPLLTIFRSARLFSSRL